MRTFAFISQKGGSGKSTLARQLAVLVSASGMRAVLVDLDPQQTTAGWWSRRQASMPDRDNPSLLEATPARLDACQAALGRLPGETLMFIDTRPATEGAVAQAAEAADLVVVPVRPSADDIDAVRATRDMLRRLNKRAVVVVNAARVPARAMAARAALSSYGIPVCPHHVSDRTAFADAALAGAGVGELGTAGGRHSLEELQRVWGWICEEAAR